MRKMRSAAAIVLTGLLLAACGGAAATSAPASGSGGQPAKAATTATAAAGGTITFGADFTEPPGQVMINGKMSGSDYEICNAIASAMGLRAKWVDISFGSLVSALNAQRIDAACSSVDVTAAREKVVSFVQYRTDSEGAAVQYGNPKHVTGPADLCGLNAAELLGSVYQTRVEQQSAACVKAGKKAINLKTFPTVADAFAQILNGRADVVVGDAPIMSYYVKEQPKKASLAFQGVNPTPVGIAVRKGDGALQSKLQTGLKQIEANGTYAKILAHWNLASEALTTAQ